MRKDQIGQLFALAAVGGVAVAGLVFVANAPLRPKPLGSGLGEKARLKSGLEALKRASVSPLGVFAEPTMVSFPTWASMFENLPKPATDYLDLSLDAPKAGYRWWTLVQALTHLQGLFGEEEGAEYLRTIVIDPG